MAWYLQDRLGSVGDLVDNTGALIDHIVYSAFGNVASESSLSNGDRFKYAGLENDGATGLNFALYRVQDAVTGRWLSEDRIGFSGRDANLDRYVDNRPTGYADPEGLQAKKPIRKIPSWANDPSLDPSGQTPGPGFNPRKPIPIGDLIRTGRRGHPYYSTTPGGSGWFQSD